MQKITLNQRFRGRSWIGAKRDKVLRVGQFELCLWNSKMDKPSKLWDVLG